MRAKFFIVQLFSGLLVPIAFFPECLKMLSMVLPFQAVAYIPLNLYLGKSTGNDALISIAVQIGWVVVLYSLGRFFWTHAAEKLTLQGG